MGRCSSVVNPTPIGFIGTVDMTNHTFTSTGGYSNLSISLRGIAIIPGGTQGYMIGYGTISLSLHTLNPHTTAGTTYGSDQLDGSDQIGVAVRSDGSAVAARPNSAPAASMVSRHAGSRPQRRQAVFEWSLGSQRAARRGVVSQETYLSVGHRPDLSIQLGLLGSFDELAVWNYALDERIVRWLYESACGSEPRLPAEAHDRN